MFLWATLVQFVTARDKKKNGWSESQVTIWRRAVIIFNELSRIILVAATGMVSSPSLSASARLMFVSLPLSVPSAVFGLLQ